MVQGMFGTLAALLTVLRAQHEANSMPLVEKHLGYVTPSRHLQTASSECTMDLGISQQS